MPGPKSNLTVEAESELSRLTQNLQQVQEKFLQQWTGEPLQRFMKEDHDGAIVANVQKTKDGIEEVKQDIQNLKHKAENNELAADEQRQQFKKLKQNIDNTDKDVQQLLFKKEEGIRKLETGAAELQEQKQLLEAQDRATKQRLRELNKAEGLYRNWLGLRFKNIGGGRLQFAFSRIDPNDHDRVFFFTLKIVDNNYEVTDCHPSIVDLSQMSEKLNSTNNLMEFVVSIRKKFKELL